MNIYFLCMNPYFKKRLIAKSVLFTAISICTSCNLLTSKYVTLPLSKVSTFAGINKEFGEPFGIAIKGSDIYVSDGEKGIIWKLGEKKQSEKFASGLDTPSGIAFDSKGDLIVADSGSHSIRKISANGAVQTIAGTDNTHGYRDGDAKSALFYAPIGVAISGERIYVADTYNDRIRVIENGMVSTVAGNSKGFSDALIGTSARFDTPCGLAVWTDGRLLVADAGNRRIRVVEPGGNTWTLSGTGRDVLTNGLLSASEFVQPTGIAVGASGTIYVADGNAIRVIGRRAFPVVETISSNWQGFADGKLKYARFNSPTGLAVDNKGNLFVADSENRLIRVFSGGNIGRKVSQKDFDKIQTTAEEFRKISKPRWPYDPPERKREIAGTIGEIRGEIKENEMQAWFHNGLDIVGGYGEIARFIRDEKVLRPIAVQNFATTRELIRMPTLGYIHIRLGRDLKSVPFDDPRFQFSFDANGKPKGIRIPRGSKFRAGDGIGTLNNFNHVHLITGRSGREMNALDALILPDASDSRAPTIEGVTLYDEDWGEIETRGVDKRIELNSKTRIVLNAYDQMDGNAARRKLGLYKLGYQILDEEKQPIKGFEKPKWTIKFDKMPNNDAVKFVYAVGSKSGATGETTFRYIISNEVSRRKTQEGFFNAKKLSEGKFILRVLAADFFGNITSKDVEFNR